MQKWRRPSQRATRVRLRDRLLPGVFWLVRVLTLLLLIAVGLWVYLWVRQPQALPIRTVAIQASYQHLDQKTLQRIITPYLQAGLFKLDLDGLHQALLQLSWVDSATIKRIWPNKLVIQITERQAVARWGGKALLSNQGVVFNPPPSSFPANLPLLNGPDEQTAVFVWQQFQRFNDLLAPLQLHIVELDLTPRHAWSLVLSNGVRVFLGRLNVTDRLQRFIQLYPKLFVARGNELESVDLRYPDGMAVRWRDSRTYPAAPAKT